MKRFVCFLLVLNIMLLSTVDVFASNSCNQKVCGLKKPMILNELKITDNDDLRIKSEINKLQLCHIDTSAIENVNITKKGDEFTLNYGDIIEKVIVQSNNKNVIIKVSDGKKSNEIIFKYDGSILLDGNEVQISQVEPKTSKITLFSGGKVWEGVKSLSPYGKLKSSDYNKYVSSKKQNISLGKSLDQLTVTALTSLIGTLHSYIGIAVSLAGVASHVYKVIVNINPKTKYLGCSYITYRAGSSDYKYINKFYANSQCTGKYHTEISYEHFTVY